MTIAVGNDIVSVSKLRRILTLYGDRFLYRHFTIDEIAHCNSKMKPYIHFAGKFAAKEAVAKSIGLQWKDGFGWRDIAIGNDSSGAPVVSLTRSAARVAGRRRFRDIKVSISHCEEYATAVAIAICSNDDGTEFS